MRITLSGAMRARDVSRPSDEQLAAAASREEAASRTSAAGRAGHGPADGADRSAPAAPVTASPTVAGPTTAGPTTAGPQTAPDGEVTAPRRRRRRRG